MEPLQMDWVPPESFDEYRLVKPLGRGSTGQVWLAHDTVLDRLVAVKLIADLPAHDAVRRLLTEARAAARVQHPNIIAVYRVGKIGRRPYLTSEYVAGHSLDKLARPVAWPRLLEIARGLARGLAAAHRRGVVHRDLKPASAILSDDGEVKLLDFGLAKLLPLAPPHADARAASAAAAAVPGDPTIAPQDSSEPSGPPRPPPDLPRVGTRGSSGAAELVPPVTNAGGVIGTPAYMPPEVWRGEPATPRSDVYSLGALLYELGAGAPPHTGDSPDALRRSAVETDPPPLAVAAPGVDRGFAAVVDRCLRRDPVERFASGDAVCAALEAIGDPTDSGGLARPQRPSRGPRRAILFAGALAVVLAGVTYTTLGEDARRPGDAARSPAQAQRPSKAALPAARVAARPERCPEGMVSVPAGTFRMGSLDGDDDEQPQHDVTLSAYCIDTTEVTVAAYAACVNAGACRAAQLTVNSTNYSAEELGRYSRSCNRTDRPDHPINCVDWVQATAYCTWKRARLPTEAEWEYAARGNDGRVYPWGNDAPSANRLSLCATGCTTTDPVGSYPEGASPFGALDMAGNVGEWTADWYGAYPAQPETDPRGPTSGTSRVSRGGGGWVGAARTTDREWPDPTVRAMDRGFRCARGN